jgi:hypothetical protein
MVLTDGTLTGPALCTQQKAAAVKITASRMDATLDDIASALTQSLSKDGQTVPTANLPMGGYKLTGLAAGNAAGNSVRYEQLAETINPASANLTLGPSTADDIQFQSGGAGRFKWDDGDVSLFPNTSLAYDVGKVAALWRAVYTALVSSGANELILSSGASGGISFRVSTFVCWRLNEFTGGLDQNATNGGNITFSKAGTGVLSTVSANVSAAGSVIGDATALTTEINRVGSVSLGQGVKLPDSGVGARVVVYNETATALKIYPPTGSVELNSTGLGNPFIIDAGAYLIAHRISSTKFIVLIA